MAAVADSLEVRITARFEELQTALNNANQRIDQFANRAGNSMRSVSDSAKETDSVFSNLLSSWIVQVGLFYGAFKTVNFFGDLIKDGVNFNTQMELSKLGIATLIMAQSNFTDSQGKAVDSQVALNSALSISDGLMQKLRIAGIQTAATTQELAQAFQTAIPVAFAQGVTNLDKILQITTGITQVAGTLPQFTMDQLPQEIRGVLQGDTSRQSRINQLLQVTKAELDAWQKNGEVENKILERLEPYRVTGEKIAQTLTATISNAKDAKEAITGFVESGFQTNITSGMNAAMAGIIDIKNLGISSDLSGLLSLLKAAFDDFGSSVASAMSGGVDALKSLSSWIDDNRGNLATVFDGFTESAKAALHELSQMTGLLPDLSTIFKKMADHINLVQAAFAGLFGYLTGTFFGAIVKLGFAIAASIASTTEMATSIGSLAGPIGTIVGLLGGLAMAIWNLKDAQDGLKQSTSAYDEMIAKLKELEIAKGNILKTSAKQEIDETAVLSGQLPLKLIDTNDAKLQLDAIDEKITDTKAKLSNELKEQFYKTEMEHNLPSGLLKAVAMTESSFNPKALSGKGAGGIMQLMPGTARQYGVTDVYDVQQAKDGAARYFDDLLVMFKDQSDKLAMAIAAYNAGPNRVKQAIAAGGKDWFAKLPEETRKYVPAVFKRMGQEYAPGVIQTPKPPAESTEDVKGLEDAKLRLQEQSLKEATDAELREIAKRRAQVEMAYKLEFISASVYYKQIGDLNKAETTANITELNKRKALYEAQLKTQKAGTTEYVKTQTDIGRLNDQIAQEASKGIIKQIQNTSDLTKSQLDLQKVLDDTYKKINALTRPNPMQDAAAAIKESHKKDLEAFKGAGMSEGVTATLKLSGVETAHSQLELLKQKFQEVMATMQATEQSYNVQVNAGILTQYDAQNKILDLHKTTSAELKKIIDDYYAAAIASGEYTGKTKVDLAQMNAQLEQTKYSQSQDAMQVKNTAQGAFADMFTSTIMGTKSVSEAFKDMCKTIEQEILNLIAKRLFNKFIEPGLNSMLDFAGLGSGGTDSSKSIFGMIGSLFSGGGGAAAAAGGLEGASDIGGLAMSFAGGGEVPGTGMYKLHEQEMVLPKPLADVVRSAAGGQQPSTQAAQPSTVNHNVNLSGNALNMTMRDWLEREITQMYATR